MSVIEGVYKQSGQADTYVPLAVNAEGYLITTPSGVTMPVEYMDFDQTPSVLWIDGVANVADAQVLASINTTIANASNALAIHQGRVLCIEPSR